MQYWRIRRCKKAKKILTHNLSEPLQGVKTAKFDINTRTGNLMIDRLNAGEGLLTSGSLEYLEKQDPPAWTVEARDGQATFTLKASGGRQPGFRLPWTTCNGETNWQIHLNPMVSADISAHTGGGNVKVNLAGMTITRVLAEAGWGNLDMTLPESASDLSVTAKSGRGNGTLELGSSATGNNTVTATSGAGNVVVRVPAGVAALIHAATGMGKVIIDSRFRQIDKNTYQSPYYDSTVDRVEIDANSGAGNVSIITK
jgi:hypothetical protein